MLSPLNSRLSALALCLLLPGCASSSPMATKSPPKGAWEIGTPIVAYYHGPGGGGGRWGPLTDGMARKLVEGGFNVAWGTSVEDLDVAHAHGLRVDLIAWDLREPEYLDDPEARARIDSVIDRVKDHPALYAYAITDEPSAVRFPEFARLVDYIRQRDPAHLAHINLFPTYASAAALGTSGGTVEAYREHLRQYVDVVKPDLISYDHYNLYKTNDGNQYFMNLALVREAALYGAFPSSTSYRPFPWASPTAYPPATRAGTWPIPPWPTAARAFRISCTGPTRSSMEAFPNSKTRSGTPSAPQPTSPPR